MRVAIDTRSDYDSAVRLLEQEQYEQGIALLLKVTESAPDVTAPHIDLGIAYGQIGRSRQGHREPEDARSSSIRATRSPTTSSACSIAGRANSRAARASYEKALALSPEFHFARLNLAILCDLYLADLGCALENYVAYQQAVPDDANAAKWIADLRARTSQ